VRLETEFDGKDEWAFRGQDADDFPASSLERHCENIGISGPAVSDLEVKLIRDFARRYHLYSGSEPPPKGNTLEWLSLLRHYGTPTRLVDFTYSFFIAVYFALEPLEAAKKPAVVWALDVGGLKNEADLLIAAKVPKGYDQIQKFHRERDGDSFRALFMDNSRSPLRFAYSTNPIRLNDRLTVQQGVFLVPGDVSATFEANLLAVPGPSTRIVKVVLDPACRPEVLRKLHKVGINAATLFPGLEGFGRSLRTKSLILKDLPIQGTEMLEQV